MSVGIVILFISPLTRTKLRTYDIFFTVACGFLALIPDIIQKLYLGDWTGSHPEWMNLFFLHVWLDQLDPTESVEAMIYASILFVLLLFAWKEKIKADWR